MWRVHVDTRLYAPRKLLTVLSIIVLFLIYILKIKHTAKIVHIVELKWLALICAILSSQDKSKYFSS